MVHCAYVKLSVANQWFLNGTHGGLEIDKLLHRIYVYPTFNAQFGATSVHFI